MGQVIDAAMVDGVSILSQMMWTMKSTGALKDERESFLLDGGAPYYRTYETSDGKYVAVGAIEPQFFAQLLDGLGFSPDEVTNQLDVAAFPRVRELFAERFASKTRDEWTEIFAGTDACVTPVLTWTEAAQNTTCWRAQLCWRPTVSSRPRQRRGSHARRRVRSADRRKSPPGSRRSAGGEVSYGIACARPPS